MAKRNHDHPGVKAPNMKGRPRLTSAVAHRSPRRTRTALPAREKPPATGPGRGEIRHALMFAGALGFLTAVGLVLPHGDSGKAFREGVLTHALFAPMIGALWAAVIAEGLLGVSVAPDAWPKRWKRLLLTAWLPPLRMIIATGTPSGRLWLPGAGWRFRGEETSEQLEQKFALPMFVLALLVLPVLAVEFAGGEALDSHPRLALATHLTTSVIWVGFTVEFLLMVAAAPKRLTYCRQNWINLVIIVVPLAAFLRVLTMFRLARVVRAGRLLRTYRLRGLFSRIWRLAMLLNLFERVQQRDPAKYCAALETKVANLEAELAALRAKLDAARERIPPPPD